MAEEKILRNPTEAEIKQQLDKDVVEGVEENIIQNETKDTDSLLKPQTSEFEPKPVKFRLVSDKLTVPSNKLTKDNEIFVRRFTTVEESYFQKFISSYKNKSMFDINSYEFIDMVNKMMDGCIKTQISVYDLSLIDKIPLFIFLLGLSYGQEYDFTFECNACEQSFKHKVNLAKDIKIKYLPANYKYPSFELTDIKDVVAYLKYPKINSESIFIQSDNIISQILLVIDKIEGTKNDGTKITEEDYENIINNLSSKDKKEIKNFIEDFSQYGTQFNISKKICKNEKCELHKKEQTVTIPLQEILVNILF